MSSVSCETRYKPHVFDSLCFHHEHLKDSKSQSFQSLICIMSILTMSGTCKFFAIVIFYCLLLTINLTDGHLLKKVANSLSHSCNETMSWSFIGNGKYIILIPKLNIGLIITNDEIRQELIKNYRYMTWVIVKKNNFSYMFVLMYYLTLWGTLTFTWINIH